MYLQWSYKVHATFCRPERHAKCTKNIHNQVIKPSHALQRGSFNLLRQHKCGTLSLTKSVGELEKKKNSILSQCVETHLCHSVRQCRKGCINGWAGSIGSWPSRPATASIYTLLVNIYKTRERHTHISIVFFNSKGCFFWGTSVTIGCLFRRSAIWLG